MVEAAGHFDSNHIIDPVLKAADAHSGKLHKHMPFNERQRLILNKLFDDFEGKLQTSKWVKISKTYTDTSLRDIKDLVEKGILQQTYEGERSSSYKLTDYKYE